MRHLCIRANITSRLMVYHSAKKPDQMALADSVLALWVTSCCNVTAYTCQLIQLCCMPHWVLVETAKACANGFESQQATSLHMIVCMMSIQPGKILICRTEDSSRVYHLLSKSPRRLIIVHRNTCGGRQARLLHVHIQRVYNSLSQDLISSHACSICRMHSNTGLMTAAALA